eukprot:6401428-Pyramimonas_sp.AAC.1
MEGQRRRGRQQRVPEALVDLDSEVCPHLVLCKVVVVAVRLVVHGGVPVVVDGPRRHRPPEEVQQATLRLRMPVTLGDLGGDAGILHGSIHRAPAHAARRGTGAARGGKREFGNRWRLRRGARQGFG